VLKHSAFRVFISLMKRSPSVLHIFGVLEEESLKIKMCCENSCYCSTVVLEEFIRQSKECEALIIVKGKETEI